MFKDKNGQIVYNRAELTEDKCRQTKADTMVVSRNFLQDLLNDSAKLNRIREYCDKVEADPNQIVAVTHQQVARNINRIIKEKL